jgi:hypothetical protein
MSAERQVFYQDAAPTARNIGDQWIDSDGVVRFCYGRAGIESVADLWASQTSFEIEGQALTSGQMWVGDSNDLAAPVAMSADGSLSDTGALTNLNMSKQVYNASGSDIITDKLVAVLGFDTSSGLPKIVLADADVAAHDDIWVTTATIANSASGTVKKRALSAADLNTDSASSAGDPVYLSTTAGGFVHTAPTGNDDRVHPVGWVVVKHATTGQIQWDVGPVRKIAANDYQALSIPAAAIVNGILDASKVATVADANVVGGIPVEYRVTATALTGDVDVTITYKTRVTDVYAIQVGGAGGAGDTITVKNGATAITDALDLNVADGTRVNATTYDDAQWEIAAAGTLRVTGASGVTAEVVIRGLRVA